MKAYRIVDSLLEADDFSPEDVVHGASELYHPDLEEIMQSEDTPPEFKDAVLSKGNYEYYFYPEDMDGVPKWPHRADDGTWYLESYKTCYTVKGGEVFMNLDYVYNDSIDSQEEGVKLGSSRYEELKRTYSWENYYQQMIGYLEFILESGTDPVELFDVDPDQLVDHAAGDLAEIKRRLTDPENALYPAWD